MADNRRIDLLKKNDTEAAGALIFSSTVAKQLVADRFPTTYVGVQRLRPSSRSVALVAKGQQQRMAKTSDVVVYKIIDEETGAERRMTAREKKQHKRQAMEEARKRKREQAVEQQSAVVDASAEVTTAAVVASSVEDASCYMPLQVNPLRLADELSDLRGEREGVPPVFLPPPIVRLLRSPDQRLAVQLDDAWAATWAAALQASLRPAETTRQSEDLRPMPYRLVPEVWSRLRPAEIGTTAASESPSTKVFDRNALQAATLRPEAALDTHTAAVLQLLHVGTGLHLSCGAKFGCDYLLYDGPRSERHAFAGLRMVSSQRRNPSPYDLSGYVRTLNTAGKLALLASVKEEQGHYHVAIIDLALVKVATTTFQKPRKTMDDRLKNLAKH